MVSNGHKIIKHISNHEWLLWFCCRHTTTQNSNKLWGNASFKRLRHKLNESSSFSQGRTINEQLFFFKGDGFTVQRMCNYDVTPFNSIAYKTMKRKIHGQTDKRGGRGEILPLNSVCMFRLDALKYNFCFLTKAFWWSNTIICLSRMTDNQTSSKIRISTDFWVHRKFGNYHLLAYLFFDLKN